VGFPQRKQRQSGEEIGKEERENKNSVEVTLFGEQNELKEEMGLQTPKKKKKRLFRKKKKKKKKL